MTFNTAIRCALAAFLACSAHANALPRGKAEDAGFSAQRLRNIDRLYAEKIRNGEMSGMVTLIARHGKIVHFSALGDADIEAGRRMHADTIFRLYSMTKPIASTALMMLYEEGRFQMTDPLAKFIPEFADLRVLRTPDSPLSDTVPAKHPPTIRDLMRHTAGFTHCAEMGSNVYDAHCRDVFDLDVSLAEMIRRLSRIPLRYQPGTRFVYSIAPDIQARLVEVLSGMDFDQFLKKRLFEPIRMKDTRYRVPPDEASRLATFYWMENGRLVPRDDSHRPPVMTSVLFEPWMINSYTADHARKGGSIGLTSTAEDYWRFAQMMLNRGSFGGVQILSPRTIDFMTRDHMENIEVELPWNGIGFGIGFAVVKDPVAFGMVSVEGSYFFQGLGGTAFWIDPKNDLVVVAMVQGPGDALLYGLRSLVYGALTDAPTSRSH
jgi:CubicO group peptidase (beta-lactamase class C family)